MQTKNLLAGVVMAATTLSFAGVANAQEYTWTGSSDSSWFTAANWDHDSGPDFPDSAEHEVIIANAETSPVLDFNAKTGGAGNITIGSLTIQAGGFLTVSNSGDIGEKLVITDTGTPNGDVFVATQGQLLLSAKALVEVVGPMEIQAGTSNPGGQMRVEDDTAELELDDVLTIGFHATNPGRLRIGELPGTSDVGGTVKLTGAVTHLIDGNLELRNEDSVLDINASMTLGYTSTPGFLFGMDNDAEIRLASGVTLINNGTIQGGVHIYPQAGSPIFHNQRISASSDEGVVRANNGLVIDFDENVVITDEEYVSGTTYRPIWASIGSGSLLAFRDGAADNTNRLEGDFVVHQGEFRFCDDAYTFGTLQTSGGGFAEGLTNKFFTYDSFSFVAGSLGSCP